jgi:HK97 family phage portal protein
MRTFTRECPCCGATFTAKHQAAKWCSSRCSMRAYQRRRRGREDARQSPLGLLISNPSPSLDPVTFWSWFILQRHIHGAAFAMKVRDRGGRPVQLQLVHPSRIRYGLARGEVGQGDDVGAGWWFCTDVRSLAERRIPGQDFIAWRRPSPRHPEQVLSPLEQLRDTLEMEAAVRLSARAMFARGGKHSMLLKTPKNFGNGTSAVLMRLADQYAARHGGPDNHGRPLILEDGMDAVPLDMNNVDLEYIEIRRLNREEVAAAFDIPPPAIGILDRATFSNVTEQNRMLYRLTMPPLLQSFESMINFDLRDGRHGRTGPPDFGEAFYFEHLIDGVLRGSTEDRIAANAQAIQTGQMTPAEARDLENRPFIEGSDRLFINTAMAPFDDAPGLPAGSGAVPAALPQAAGPGAGSVPGPGQRAALDADVVAKAMGRLSRVPDLDAVDTDTLTAGMEPVAAEVVAKAVDHVRDLGGDVAGLRRLIKELGQR